MRIIIIGIVVSLLQVNNVSYAQYFNQHTDSEKGFTQKTSGSKIKFLISEKKELSRDSMLKSKYALICDTLANIYKNLGKYKKAEKLYTEAKYINEKIFGKSSIEYTSTCNRLGVLYRLMGKYQKAESFFLESKLWKYYSDSAKVYSDQKNWDKAIEFYIKAMTELKRDSLWTSSYSQTSINLAEIYANIGQYEKAEVFYDEARKVMNPNLGIASFFTTMANHDLYYGNYKRAEVFYLRAREARAMELGVEHPDYAESCNNLANLYNETGQYTKAESLYVEACHIWEKKLGRMNSHCAKGYDDLANLYVKTGQYEKADSIYLETKLIRENALGNKSLEHAESCDNLANLCFKMGQYERAELLYIEAKKIKEKALSNQYPEYGKSCNDLALLYEATGQYKRAESLYLEARQIWTRVLGKKHPYYAKSCNGLAVLYSDMHQHEKAEPLFLEARQIREEILGKDHPDYAQTCSNLADLYKDMGQYQKAESLYLEARHIRENVLGKAHPDYAQTCNNLANLYWVMKEKEKANELYAEAFNSQNIEIKEIFQFTNEVEQQLYLKKIADLENFFFSFIMSPYSQHYQELSYDVSLFNRNLILSSSQQLRNIIFNSNDTIIKNKYNKWINTREQLAYWYHKPIAERPAYIQTLEDHANTLEKELAHLSSDFRKDQLKIDISWQNIQQKLKPNEAAIEFVKFNLYNGERWTDSAYYVALLLTKNNREPEFIPLFENRQLNNLLKAGNTYQAITKLYSNNKEANAAYNLIWKPIETHLKDIQKIYFAPAGLLYRISFQALPITEHETLGDKYELIQLNSTASVLNQSENFIDSSDKIFLYGGIKYDADSAALKQAVLVYHTSPEIIRFIPDDLTRSSVWQYLPGTETEIEKIDSLSRRQNYFVRLSSGVTASEESIKALDGEASPSVLHIATHGFFFPDPKEEKKNNIRNSVESVNPFKQSNNPLFRSGLLFAGANNAWTGGQIKGVEDGILTAFEVSNLYLPNTKLVVLSACETGLGDIQGNEGVYGLQRAFKIAGVKNLIMSLWRVPDKETAEFMQQFYKNIFDKLSIEDAFYLAQTIMRNKYRNNPYKWTAWILVK